MRRTLRAARDRGVDLLAPSLTVGQWLDSWLTDIKGFDGTRPATLTMYRVIAERYVKPVLGGIRLDKLTPAHVQHLVKETRNSETTRGTPPSLRRGELLALRWDDVDLDSRQLRVRHALQRVDGKLRSVEPKTSSSRRSVVLPKIAVRYLEEHRNRQDNERLELGDAWREHGLVFASSVGTPIEPRNVNRRWDKLRAKAGLDWLRLHDLRHGCATFLPAQGVPARAIMEVLGHGEIGVTMNTYAHVLPQLRQEAADAMDELFGS